MSKRKPLPYAAAFLSDRALMEIRASRKLLHPLLQVKDLEILQRVALAMQNLNEAEKALIEQRSIHPGSSGVDGDTLPPPG